MKLIRQSNLSNTEGNSDKVYEVDLCEVGTDQFVVNYRYGRRGGTLRDGTKTPIPVDRAKADEIFDNLVDSKKYRGYVVSSVTEGQSAASSMAPPPVSAEVPQLSDPVAQGVLNRLARGHQESRWKLSRAIWRAGELGLAEAEPLIRGLIGTGDAMLDYVIAATLSRIGTASSSEALIGLINNKSLPAHVRRMAEEAGRQISDHAQRAELVQTYIRQLPSWCQSLAERGPETEFARIWSEHLQQKDRKAVQSISTLYMIDNEYVRPALLQTLRSVPLEPSFFRHLRHIFKTSELRRDSEVFGIMAGRFAKVKHGFVMSPAWYYSRRTKPTVGDSAQQAYSKQTRDYLRRRVWRTLERLGTDGSSDYCKLATGILLQFTDDDAQQIQSFSKWDSSYRLVNVYCDGFGRYWAFSNILFRNSSRYERVEKKLRFDCTASFDPTQHSSEPRVREEAFATLWDQSPELLLRLLRESRCERVHQFAGLALIANKSFCDQIDLALLIDLLDSTYESTCTFALEAAIDRYDPGTPDPALVLALANCTLQRGRSQAHRWIEVQRQLFFEDLDFTVAMVTSDYSDTRLFARDSLRVVQIPSELAERVVQRSIDHMLQLNDSDSGRSAAEEIGGTIAQAFPDPLSRIDDDTLRSLLEHPLSGVQLLGGQVILGHSNYSRQPPPELLHRLIGSEHETVRRLGLGIVEQLGDIELRRSDALLLALTRHPKVDVRRQIRPIVQRIVASDAGFAVSFANQLIEALLRPGAPEGVPSHTSMILIEDFRDKLTHVDASTVWKLLQSRSQPAQDLGGTLLPTNVRPDSLSVEELVKLASHDVLSVREACWTMCRQSVPRLRSAMASAVRILDAKWQDSREFGFELFREFFENSALSPSVLVSICDSVREDVQRFGCDLITKRFESEDGQEYLLKLSEHPSVALQLFATNFLDRYAVDDPERLAALRPYFMSVLTRVNQARVAKNRVLQLLAREAAKSEASARVVSEIMAQLSATASIGDRAQSIEIMMDISQRYPSIQQPIEVIPLEVR